MSVVVDESMSGSSDKSSSASASTIGSTSESLVYIGGFVIISIGIEATTTSFSLIVTCPFDVTLPISVALISQDLK